MMLMLLVSTNVLAVDWVKTGEADSFTNYVDPQSIRRTGNIVRVWSLSDHKSGQVLASIRYLSKLTKVEYDCFEDTMREIDLYFYAEKMGTGDIVFSLPNFTKPATSLPPGSVAAAELKAVCATK